MEKGETSINYISVIVECKFCGEVSSEKIPEEQLAPGKYVGAQNTCRFCDNPFNILIYLNPGEQQEDTVHILGQFQNSWLVYDEAEFKDVLESYDFYNVKLTGVHHFNQKLPNCDRLELNYIQMDVEYLVNGKLKLLHIVVYGQGNIHTKDPESYGFYPATIVRVYGPDGLDHMRRHGPTPIIFHRRNVIARNEQRIK